MTRRSKAFTNMIRGSLKDKLSVLDTLNVDMLIKGLILKDVRIGVITTATEGVRVLYGTTEELASLVNLISDQTPVLSFQVFDFEFNDRFLKEAKR